MAVSYTLAVQHSWARMVRMLFRPFRLDTWLVLGFAAFLSEFLSHPPSARGGWSMRETRPEVPESVRHVAAFLLHPAWGAALVAIVAVLSIVLLLLIWLSCRGKFVFLDNVARERVAIVEPWKRFRRHGSSLFAFWLGMTLVAASIGLAIALPFLITVLQALQSGEVRPVVTALLAASWLAMLAPFVLVTMFAFLLLEQFVVPIMYRDDLGVFAAWRRLFSLAGVHKLEFIGYALFFLVVSVALGVAVVIAGFATCCVGFILLVIPYVSSVVLLPIEVTLRGMGPDFLAQYGPEWSIYAKLEMPPPAPAPPPAPPPQPRVP
jgi:hypothetical protein